MAVMTMLIVGLGIGVTAGSAVVVRKTWIGFHKAVGISPKTMRYVEKSQAPNVLDVPSLIQVKIPPEKIERLPTDIQLLLKNIDDKADTFQEWRGFLENNMRNAQPKSPIQLTANATKNATDKYSEILLLTENQFVLSKLMSEHVPHSVDSFLQVFERKVKLNTANPNSSELSSFDEGVQQSHKLLVEILLETEAKLDTLLAECEAQHINQLETMKRYIKAR